RRAERVPVPEGVVDPAEVQPPARRAEVVLERVGRRRRRGRGDEREQQRDRHRDEKDDDERLLTRPPHAAREANGDREPGGGEHGGDRDEDAAVERASEPEHEGEERERRRAERETRERLEEEALPGEDPSRNEHGRPEPGEEAERGGPDVEDSGKAQPRVSNPAGGAKATSGAA